MDPNSTNALFITALNKEAIALSQMAAMNACSASSSSSANLAPPSEREVFRDLTNRFNSSASSIISLTGEKGQTLTVARIPTPRVGTADAAARTVRERSLFIENVIDKVVSPPKASKEEKTRDVSAQVESMVKRRKTEYSNAVESATGITVRERFTVNDILELKKVSG